MLKTLESRKKGKMSTRLNQQHQSCNVCSTYFEILVFIELDVVLKSWNADGAVYTEEWRCFQQSWLMWDVHRIWEFWYQFFHTLNCYFNFSFWYLVISYAFSLKIISYIQNKIYTISFEWRMSILQVLWFLAKIMFINYYRKDSYKSNL